MAAVAPPLIGTFTGTGRSDTVHLKGVFNLSISGTFVATVTLDRSFDNGVTWIIMDTFTEGFSSPTKEEPENNVIWSLNCSAFTSGTVTFRISQ